MYEAIVFDLDGTLLDTLDDLFDAVNVALKKNGLPLRTKEEVRSFVGNGIVKLMERASGSKENVDKEKLVEDFKNYYGEHCKDKTKPYDGILEALRSLRRMGVKTGVLSNKADFAVKLLAKEYFDGLLDMAAGENEAAGIRKKPAPDALFTAMQSLGTDKTNTLYVGDSEVDIQTAKNAGIACVLVTWGFKDRAFLLENGAEILIDEPKELIKIAEA